MDSLIRQRFGPHLRALGFIGGPSTWRRVHDDRIDVINLSGSLDQGTGQNRLGLSYGVRFQEVHKDDTDVIDPAKVRTEHLDLELFDLGSDSEEPAPDGLDEAALEATARRLREVVVPFLDTLAHYDAARAAIETDTDIPSGSHQTANPGSFARWDLPGRLALAHQDKETAENYLKRALVRANSWQDSNDSLADDWKAVKVARLENLLNRARRLR